MPFALAPLPSASAAPMASPFAIGAPRKPPALSPLPPVVTWAAMPAVAGIGTPLWPFDSAASAACSAALSEFGSVETAFLPGTPSAGVVPVVPVSSIATGSVAGVVAFAPAAVAAWAAAAGPCAVGAAAPAATAASAAVVGAFASFAGFVVVLLVALLPPLAVGCCAPPVEGLAAVVPPASCLPPAEAASFVAPLAGGVGASCTPGVAGDDEDDAGEGAVFCVALFVAFLPLACASMLCCKVCANGCATLAAFAVDDVPPAGPISEPISESGDIRISQSDEFVSPVSRNGARRRQAPSGA